MIKDDIHEVCNDLRAKRDALANFHQQLKRENDNWNKAVITLSLFGGFIESVKMQLGLETSFWKLAPIGISSIIAIMSSLIKFKKFPEQMEVLITAQGLLVQIITKVRNNTVLTEELWKEYNDGLEKCESALYPDDRKHFLKQAHKNLIAIAVHEKKYYSTIEKVNDESVSANGISLDDVSPKSSEKGDLIIPVPRPASAGLAGKPKGKKSKTKKAPEPEPETSDSSDSSDSDSEDVIVAAPPKRSKKSRRGDQPRPQSHPEEQPRSQVIGDHIVVDVPIEGGNIHVEVNNTDIEAPAEGNVEQPATEEPPTEEPPAEEPPAEPPATDETSTEPPAGQPTGEENV